MEVKGKYYTMKELENMVTMYEKQSQGFIGNKDIEYHTFLTMSLDDLRELVKVNQYLKSIINTDDFWCQYLHKHYNVSYKTECLHIGNALLKNNLTMPKFYQKMIKQKDIAVVKFLLDSVIIGGLTYEDLTNITYIPLINLLINYIEDDTYLQKDAHIKILVRADNINVINQLLKYDRISVKLIKKLLEMYMSKEMKDILSDYYNMTKIFFEEMGLASELGSSDSDSSDSDSSDSDSSDSDDLPRYRPANRSPGRRRSPVKPRHKSPARRRSPVKRKLTKGKK